MKVIFLFSLDVELIFSVVEGLFQMLFVLLQSIVQLAVVVLLHLGESVVLEQCLLKLSAQPHAFISIGLNLTLALAMLAHFYILL